MIPRLPLFAPANRRKPTPTPAPTQSPTHPREPVIHENPPDPPTQTTHHHDPLKTATRYRAADRDAEQTERLGAAWLSTETARLNDLATGAGTFGRPARDAGPVERALTDLREVEQLAPLLALLRDPTAKRPWREVILDPYARAELDDAARQEIAERAEDAPGEHPDAARPDVLDALSALLTRAHGLAWHLSRAACHPPLPEPPADADPRPYLRRARALLAAAAACRPNADQIIHHTADEAAGMLADVRHALALVEDGHTVKAVCPWCRGGLTGGYTWRVRILAGEPLIVCESEVCNPPSRDAGTWWRGRPAWRMGDWDWLAARLAHLDARRADQTPPPLPYASFAGSTGRAGSPSTPAAEREILAGLTPQPSTSDEGTAA